MSVVYPSHEDFLISRGLALAMADSHDYGIWWRDNVGGVYRLTWLGPRRRPAGAGAPGELYLLALRGSHFGSAELLCVIPPIDDDPFEPLDGNVERLLDGWAEVCGKDGSVDWIRDRVREALAAGWAREGGVDHGHREPA